MDTIISSHHALSTLFSDLVDKLNTSACYLCGTRHDEPRKICKACRADLAPPEHPCPVCAERWQTATDGDKYRADQITTNCANPADISNAADDKPDPCCPGCSARHPPYRRCVAAFEYEFPVSEMIQQFKYGRREYWARALAEAAIPAFQRAFPTPNGVLVPMPVHNRRFSHRGFNQAESLAREISRLSGWPVLNDLCIRSLHTPRQSQLNAVARRRNLAFAFECRGPIPDCPVVVIDDVITTGSTIDALTNTLLQAGVREVDVFGFARANRRINPEIVTEGSPVPLGNGSTTSISMAALSAVKDNPVRAIFRRATPPAPEKR